MFLRGVVEGGKVGGCRAVRGTLVQSDAEQRGYTPEMIENIGDHLFERSETFFGGKTVQFDGDTVFIRVQITDDQRHVLGDFAVGLQVGGNVAPKQSEIVDERTGIGSQRDFGHGRSDGSDPGMAFQSFDLGLFERVD